MVQPKGTGIDGGPAFPRPHSVENRQGDYLLHEGQTGMSLRDWFAGQVLASEAAAHLTNCQSIDPSHLCENVVAGVAYQAADAMLRVRSRDRS